MKRFTSKNTHVTILVGTGENGGDGLVAARHLSALGYRVKIILVGKESNIVLESVKKNWKAIQFITESVEIVKAYNSSLISKIEGEIAVDALLGTGIKGSLKPPILQAVQAFNEVSVLR